VFSAPGLAIFARRIEDPGDVLELRFRLDKALPADAIDPRERGIIVERISVE
jgi:hypothetical protein